MPRRNLNSQNGVRDGSWWVDPQVVEKYRALGIDALNDPAHADDDVARDIEANRVEYAQGLNRAARLRKKEHADNMWNSQLAELGFTNTNWHKARNEMLRNARAKGLPDSQLDWLWNAGPVAWQEAGLLGSPTANTDRQNPPPTTTPTVPPPTPLPPPTPTPTPTTPPNIPFQGIRSPILGYSPTPLLGGNVGEAKPGSLPMRQPAVQPSVLSLNPTQSSAVGNTNNQLRRPPNNGYMGQPKRTTAQLGF